MFNRFRLMIRVVVPCGLALVCAVAIGPLPKIQAQPASTPLYLHVGTSTTGDLWSAAAPGAPLKQMTNWHYNYAPVLSPDGQYIAYLSAPRSVVSDILANGARSGPPPANVWVIKVATGETVQVADQPATANFDAGGYINRPTPAWSPDSKQLAWLELAGYSGGKPQYQLVAYDISDFKAPKNTFIVKNAPGYMLPANGMVGERVAWSAAGIAYTVESGTDASSGQVIPPMLYLFDAHGARLDSQTLTDQTCGVFGWTSDAQPVLVLCQLVNRVPTYDVYNPSDQTVTSLEQFGDLHLLPPNSSEIRQLIWVPARISGYGWQLDGSNTLLDDPLAISPDGQTVVSIGDRLAYTVHDQNSATDVPISILKPDDWFDSIDWIGWGPTNLKFEK